jgi:hypothetical protein
VKLGAESHLIQVGEGIEIDPVKDVLAGIPTNPAGCTVMRSARNLDAGVMAARQPKGGEKQGQQRQWAPPVRLRPSTMRDHGPFFTKALARRRTGHRQHLDSPRRRDSRLRHIRVREGGEGSHF